jgi:riboflavin kinase/FMN adenylyltransferase
LTPAGYKRELLANAGVDRLVVLPPTQEVLNITAEDFWALLRDQSRPRHMVEGQSFNFGKNRGGTIQRLREWAAASSVQLHIADAVEVALLDLTVAPVSSSLIRWLIGNGRMRDAGICLGHAYVLEGRVVEGFKRGRTIGVPTANLDISAQLVPLEGVYAGRCTVDGTTYSVALSIGRMQTFGDKLRQQIEAHLIGFNGDLYGRELRVEVVDWVREQRKFAGVDALREQLARDILCARERGDLDVTRQIARG